MVRAMKRERTPNKGRTPMSQTPMREWTLKKG